MKRIGDTRVVSNAEAGSLAPEDVGEPLPDAGYSQNEELLRRCDDLEAQIAALTDAKTGVDRATLNPSSLKKENEILNFIDQGSFPVQNADDDLYVYCWVNRDLHGKFGGVHIYRKKAQGWEMCSFGDPEVAGIRSPEGYCVIGDVALMRITRDRHLLLHRRQQKLTDLRRSAASSELRQIGDKARAQGIVTTIEGEIDETVMDKMAKSAEAERRAKAITDKWVKAGKMPGVAVPGSR